MNQSISEEWEKLFDGHCICDKYAPQEDIGCIIHGEDGIKAKKFIQSKISQALTAERKELRVKIVDLAPNGITGNMVAKTIEKVNGKDLFPVVAVDFEHDLIALDTLGNIDNPTWYRTEEVLSFHS